MMNGVAMQVFAGQNDEKSRRAEAAALGLRASTGLYARKGSEFSEQ